MASRGSPGVQVLGRRRLGWFGGAAALGVALSAVASPLAAQAEFLRGDPDESGGIEITDAIRILRVLFLGEGQALRCRDAADADDTGEVVIGDALYLLNGLFLGGPAPPPPFPRCGVDPTEDGLDCAGYEGCKAATVRFFGFEFEAEGVFFVVDASGSFNTRGRFTRAKQEVVATISALTEDSEIAVFFFSRWLIRWPADGTPVRATEENKAAGVAFVEAMSGGQGTCPDLGLLQAVASAQRSSVEARAILYVSDGGAACDGETTAETWSRTIDAVTAANNGTASIHSIQINGDFPAAEDYMRELAEKNGGTFHQLEL